ncbi:MAG: periplasmic heavy metal sensor [Cyclobacteriaceae bacterium]|nr:periplasmic heavy metal sensor [Cyclobacteriaceae bacterium HetDA_MAG_MS6]
MKKLFLTTMMSMMMAAIVIAQPPRQGNEKGPRDRQQMAEILELTDGQKEQFESLRLAHKKATKADRDQLKLKETELSILITADSPDKKAISAQVDEISVIRSRLFESKTMHRLELRALLTDAQKIQFDQMKDRKRQGRKKTRRM